MTTSLQLMLFFWKIGLIDISSLIQFCVNIGCQYGPIVLISSYSNFYDIGPKV